jgi:uncharacterized protein (DUF2141 family)
MIIAHFALIILSIFTSTELTQNVEVNVSGIRNNRGFIIISVFKDQASFEKEKPFTSKKFDKKEMHNEHLIAKFNLEEGVYGFALLDDENNDSKMKYSFLGIPQEGFGFSNYYHSGFTKPKFEAFKLQINKQVLNKTKMKIRYM